MYRTNRLLAALFFQVVFVGLFGYPGAGMRAAVSQEGAEEDSPRLTAPKLFPDNTLAYVRINDVTQLKEDLSRSSIGKLGNDDQIKPILMEFYGTLVRSTERIQESLGINLDELLSIPSGELAVALLPNEAGGAQVERSSGEDGESVSVRVESPALALLMDAGEEISGIQVMLNRLEQSAGSEMVHEEKEVERLLLHRYRNPNRQRQQFGYFIDDGVIVACSDPIYLEQLAAKWLGQADDLNTLADNRRFTTIMSRSVGTAGKRPQLSFYADPWSIARQFTRNVSGSTFALAVLDSLGISGVEAVGGSWILAPADFDSISHLHVLLSSPRRGVLGLLRPKTGSTTPEPWVPASVATYSTINWDLASTLQAVERLYNQFRGEDALEKEVFARVKDRIGVDLRRDVLENLEGRLSTLQGFVRPVTINSGSNVYAIRVRDPDLVKSEVLPKLFEQLERRTEVRKESFGPIRAQVFEPGGNRPENAPIRNPEICVAVVDDYVLISDSRYMMRQIADCMNQTAGALVDSIEYQLISDQIEAQLQDKDCSAISFARPDESLQLFYELARDPKNRERLRDIADRNGFFKALLAALEKHELPPFSVIAKYLAPGGGYLVEEETGLHYISFSLRRE